MRLRIFPLRLGYLFQALEASGAEAEEEDLVLPRLVTPRRCLTGPGMHPLPWWWDAFMNERVPEGKLSLFKAVFRIEQSTWRAICAIIVQRYPNVDQGHHRYGLLYKMLVLLLYLAHQSDPSILALTFAVGKSTVVEWIRDLTMIFVNVLSPEFVCPPSLEEMRTLAASQRLRFDGNGLPLSFAMDGKDWLNFGFSHVTFINRKGFPALGSLGVGDCTGRMWAFVTGWPGSTHDTKRFRMSHMDQFLQNLASQQIIGCCDEGLPMTSNMIHVYNLQPHAMDPLRISKAAFDRTLVGTRKDIERCWGVIAARWKGHRTPITSDPLIFSKMITTMVTINNICVAERDIPPARHTGDLLLDGIARIRSPRDPVSLALSVIYGFSFAEFTRQRGFSLNPIRAFPRLFAERKIPYSWFVEAAAQPENQQGLILRDHLRAAWEQSPAGQWNP